MNEQNTVTLPLLEGDGTNIAADIVKEAIKQTEENLKKIDEILIKLQEQLDNSSRSLNQGKMNKAILQGQKAIADEILKKINELT